MMIDERRQGADGEKYSDTISVCACVACEPLGSPSSDVCSSHSLFTLRRRGRGVTLTGQTVPENSASLLVEMKHTNIHFAGIWHAILHKHIAIFVVCLQV